MNRAHLYWIVPLVLFILLAPFTSQLDMDISNHFYPFSKGPKHPFTNFFYAIGEYPGRIVGVLAAVLFLATFKWTNLKSLRRASLVMALTVGIGAAFLINFAFKEFWGRPRPVQTIEFGGTQTYRTFYNPDLTHPFARGNGDAGTKSFPSGHAAMGFYFLTLAVIGWYERKRWLVVTGILLGLGLGIGLSILRLSQGGHYFSDVLASALIMWLSALASAYWVYGRASDARPH